jgi:DNA transformation protein
MLISAKKISSIGDLPNLGSKSVAVLALAGIKTVAQLRKRGAVAAYAAAKRHSPRVSLNLLWALEGALTGITWQEVANVHRTSLLLALEQWESGHPD